MTKDSNGWFLDNGTWTAFKSDLEWAASCSDRAPVDPWGNVIKWGNGVWTERGWEGRAPNEEYPNHPIPLLVLL